MRIDPERVGEAVRHAAELHGTQQRKGSDVPYLAHLLSVAALVLEDGGDEDQMIAGLLHDAAEDRGGEPTLVEIEHRFGPRVARMVRVCSDSIAGDPEAKAPWEERKRQAIAQLADAPDEVLVVVAADKLHNLRSTIADFAVRGDDVWTIFKTGRDGFFWYNDQLHDLLEQRIPDSRSVAGITVELAGFRAKVTAS
jgi:(p)ppGpp synthase/HD superfamily hydrolase